MSDLNASSQIEKIEKKIKVVLTRRPPVLILESEWPYIATSEDKEYDGQYESQANRISGWDLDVRQHEKGCSLVYGRYRYDSNWRGEASHDIRGGEKLPAGANVVAAIERVAEWMREQVSRERPDDADAFLRLANECIASLPAEDAECEAEEATK